MDILREMCKETSEEEQNLNTDVAILVYNYLQSVGCDSAADKFMHTSPHLNHYRNRCTAEQKLTPHDPFDNSSLAHIVQFYSTANKFVSDLVSKLLFKPTTSAPGETEVLSNSQACPAVNLVSRIPEVPSNISSSDKGNRQKQTSVATLSTNSTTSSRSKGNAIKQSSKVCEIHENSSSKNKSSKQKQLLPAILVENGTLPPETSAPNSTSSSSKGQQISATDAVPNVISNISVIKENAGVIDIEHNVDDYVKTEDIVKRLKMTEPIYLLVKEETHSKAVKRSGQSYSSKNAVKRKKAT